MTDVTPHPKSVQLARGERRYLRKVASAKQWQKIVVEKDGRCRCWPVDNCEGPTTFHHVVDRVHGGDDVPNNIVPVCDRHHRFVTARHPAACRSLLASLTDDEYAYALGKQGEDFFERRYGLTYERAA